MAKKVTRAMKVEMFNAGKAAARAGFDRNAQDCKAIFRAQSDQQAQLEAAFFEGFDSVKV